MNTALLGGLALTLTGAALVAGAAALVATGRPAVAIAVLLDLLLAAGLLRLAGEPDWRTIAGAAALVAIRRLLGWGLRVGRSGRSSETPATPGSRSSPPADQLLRRLIRPAWRA